MDDIATWEAEIDEPDPGGYEGAPPVPRTDERSVFDDVDA